MNKYHIIVINISEERRKDIITQFEILNSNIPINCKTPVTFLRACSPENSSEYLIDSHHYYHNRICCLKSHIEALKMAYNSKYPYTLILEDDAALHKTYNFNAIEEIIDKWDTVVHPNVLFSVGWIPMKEYNYYTKGKAIGKLDCIAGSKIFNINCMGLQGYIVKSGELGNHLKNLDFKTYNELLVHVKNLGIHKFWGFKDDKEFIPSDCIINKMLGQIILFPPIIIETNKPSTLNHTNDKKYWDIFFNGKEDLRDNYFTF